MVSTILIFSGISNVKLPRNSVDIGLANVSYSLMN